MPNIIINTPLYFTGITISLIYILNSRPSWIWIFSGTTHCNVGWELQCYHTGEHLEGHCGQNGLYRYNTFWPQCPSIRTSGSIVTLTIGNFPGVVHVHHFPNKLVGSWQAPLKIMLIASTSKPRSVEL